MYRFKKNKKNKEEVLCEHHLRSVSQAIESPSTEFSSSSSSSSSSLPRRRKRIGSEMESKIRAEHRENRAHESSHTSSGNDNKEMDSSRAKRQKREGISDGIYFVRGGVWGSVWGWVWCWVWWGGGPRGACGDL